MPPTLISQPTRIAAAGNKPKLIDEYIGRVNSRDTAVSVAHMRSPQGWTEPGQTPEFDEFTVVLKGMLRVKIAMANSSACRAGGGRARRRVGAVFDAQRRGRGIHRGMRPGIFYGDSTSRCGVASQNFFGVIRSAPTYGRSTSGISTLPSAC